MSMLDGVSQCWRLSETCAVDWNAWSAIATGSGVLLALAMPALKWLRTKSRANAMFAVAFERDLQRARSRLRSINEEFPLGLDTPEAWAVEAALMADVHVRERFGNAGEPLAELADRSIDLSQWPSAVSLDLASKVVVAQAGCRSIVDALKAGSTGPDDLRHWANFWLRFRRDMDAALERCDVAIAALERASKKIANDLA